jgi:hypothetical protein
MLLTGCAMGSFSTTADAPAQVSPGGFQGSNFGGHAPIVGAEVFLLQASTSGYGTKATSLLTSAAGGTDTTIVGSAGTPAYYVTTDAAGHFNITGDYTCTPGLPVYLYAYGGAPDSNPAIGPSILTSVTWTNTGGANNTYTFTVNEEEFYVGQSVTFQIGGGALSGFNGNTYTVTSVNPSGGTTLQNTQFSIVAPESIAGSASGSYTYGGVQLVYPIGAFNPAIVNLAVLGNCPTSSPFTFGTGSSDAISFVYMNEVSTAAAAFALAPFAETQTITGSSGQKLVARTGTDAQHIGIPASDSIALAGIQNAAINAGNLYDITGATNNSSNTDGEAHVARSVLPNSGTAGSGVYGSVPEALINTLGNILAACVDSANTAGLGVTGGTYSSQCSTLFTTATANGTTSGTNPTDTATAAINIAHYPAGENNSNFVSNLYNLPGPIAPFAPVLTSQPNDFVIGINISDNNGSGVFLGTAAAPQGIAADGSGNILVTTSGCTVGCTIQYSPTNSTGLVNPVGISYTAGGTAVAVSPSDKVWVVNASQTSNGGNGPLGAFYVSSLPLNTNTFTGYGTYNSTFAKAASGTTAVSLAIDGNGVAYVGDSAELYYHKITALGAAPLFTEYLYEGQIGMVSGQLNCEDDVTGIAVDDNQYGYNIWTVDQAQTLTQGMCTADASGLTNNVATSSTTPLNTADVLSQIGPTYNDGTGTLNEVAQDMNGSGWDSNSGSANNTGVEFAHDFAGQKYNSDYGFAQGGGLNNASGVAVDGNDNIWYANTGGNSVTAFTNLGPASINGGAYHTVATALSPSTGYTASGQMSTPTQIAIDPSGDVWVTNTGKISSTIGYSITELIGVAAPTYMPLSSAAENNALGMKP